MTESSDVINQRIASLERRLRRSRWVHIGYLVFAVVVAIYLIDTRLAVYGMDGVTTTHIELVDDVGNSRGEFSALLGMTIISIHDAIDQPRASLTRWADGSLSFLMHGAITSAAIKMYVDEDGSAGLGLYDAHGNKRIEVEVGQDGNPHLALYDANALTVFEAP